MKNINQVGSIKPNYTKKEYYKNIFQDILLYDTQLSLSECATYLKKSKRTVLIAIKNKEIIATKVGKSFVVWKGQFLKYKKI